MRYLVVVIGLGLVLPCRAAAQSVPERTVANGGEDRPLAWRFVARAKLGMDQNGSSVFFRVFPWTVVADGRGRVYVLDVGDNRVGIFDASGNHLRSVGALGGGPGEFLQPVGVAVDDARTILVLDAAKGAIVRFDSAGGVQEQVRLEARAVAIGVGEGGILIGQGPTPLQQLRLVRQRDADVQTLAEVDQSTRQVRFSGCAMSVPERPLFAPDIVWASAHGTTVLNDTVAYRLVVLSKGKRTLIVRDVPSVRVTRAEALRSPGVRKGYTVRWPSGTCRVSPEELLDARGFARQVSPVERIVVVPGGGLWVQRRTTVAGNYRTDVFDAGGLYVGTLSAAIGFPSAFVSTDRFVVVESDHDGVPLVAFYDIERG